MSETRHNVPARIPDRYDPVELVEKVNENTPGSDLPDHLEIDDGRIQTPEIVSPELCELMRTLRGDMKAIEIACAIDYSKSTVSDHSQGKCDHWEPEKSPQYPESSKDPGILPVTDETKAISVRRRQYYHAYASGRPACKRTGDSYQIWDDMEMAETWKIPCSWCFPDKPDLRPEAQDE